MTTLMIRNKLHQMIDNLDDKSVNALYSIFDEKVGDEHPWDYTPEFKAELDLRYEAYKSDGIIISRESMNNRIQQILSNSSE